MIENIDIRGVFKLMKNGVEVKKPLIQNAKERKRVSAALVIFALSAAIIIFFMILGSTINFRSIRKLGGAAGTLAEIGFIFAIAMFVIRRIIKKVDLKSFKPIVITLAKLAREWHVPVAITAFSAIIIHVYIMLSRGFIFSLTYISGISALLVLAVLMISGIFRYKRKGVKLHMVLGISFIILMIIHLIS